MRYATLNILILAVIVVSGCTATPDANPISAIDTGFVPIVSVTGKLLPVTWVNVSSQTGGNVLELLVSNGEFVEEGDLLASIDDQDALSTLKQAESALTVAEAQMAQMLVGAKTEQIALAEYQLAAARSAITQTIAQREALDAGRYSTQLAAAKAQVAALTAERFIANQQHEDSMKCHDIKQPDGSTKQYCPTLGTIEEQLRMALQAADAALQSAETQRDMLYSDHQAQKNIADAAIQAAQTQADVALAQLNLVKAQVPAENIAAAAAVRDQAQVNVDIALLNLERTEIRTPISGVIGMINTREGEYITPGTVVLTIGNVQSLRVETTDLDEIDVAQIDLNQSAIITFEALPDETFTGTVDYIAPMANPGSGGVNYTVYLSLDRLDEKLRWGMTAFVDIETQN